MYQTRINSRFFNQEKYIALKWTLKRNSETKTLASKSWKRAYCNYLLCFLTNDLAYWFSTYFTPWNPKLSRCTIAELVNTCNRGLKGYNPLLLWNSPTPFSPHGGSLDTGKEPIVWLISINCCNVVVCQLRRRPAHFVH